MESVARGFGILNLMSGVILLLAPGIARRIIQARAEYAQLSDNSLRLLGLWVFLTGGVLMGATAKAEIETLMREAVSPPLRAVE